MAVVDYDKEDPNAIQGAGGTQASSIIGGGGTQAGGAAGGPVAPAPQGSGRWSNLQSYLDLNKPVAGKMAERLSGMRYGQTGAPGSVYGQQEEIGSRILEKQGEYADTMGLLGEKAQSEKEFMDSLYGGAAPTEEQIGTYGGGELTTQEEAAPQFDAGVQSDMQRYRDYLNRADTEEGRFGLLKQFEAPGTTRGESTLNQLLMQGTPDLQEKFAERKNIFDDPRSGLSEALTNVGAYTDQARGGLENLRAANLERAGGIQGYADELKTGTIDPWRQDYLDRAGGMQEELYGRYADYTRSLVGRGMSTKDAQEKAAKWIGGNAGDYLPYNAEYGLQGAVYDPFSAQEAIAEQDYQTRRAGEVFPGATKRQSYSKILTDYLAGLQEQALGRAPDITEHQDYARWQSINDLLAAPPQGV